MEIRRFLMPVLGLSALLMLQNGQGQSSLEFGIDRPGGDFRSFAMKIGEPPDSCQAACRSDPQCRAFTYVKPGVQGPEARCWLKSIVPGAVQNSSCVSGIVQPQFEDGVNRPGGDLRDFAMNHGEPPEKCQAACRSDPRCMAFTYVKPGLQGPAAHCWLKSVVPGTVPDPNCVSGVVQPQLEFGINRPGGDFRSFVMKSEAPPDECYAACRKSPQCRSFTYVKPGVQGTNPRCWLKSIVAGPVEDPNCVSGVIRD